MAVTSKKKKKLLIQNYSGISQTLGENSSLIKFIFLSMSKEHDVRVCIKIITMPLYVLMITTKATETMDIPLPEPLPLTNLLD